MGCGAIAGLALGLGGFGASEAASSMEGNAENQKLQAELARQKQYGQQGRNLFNQSLGQSTPQAATQQITQGAQQALGVGRPASQIPFGVSTVPLPGQQGQRAQGQLGATLGAGQQSNATLQGYGNYGLQQWLKDQSIGSQLGVNNMNAQRSAQVLPMELQQASQSQQGLASLGKLLSAAGLLTGLGSSIGGFGAPSAATNASVQASLNQGLGSINAATGEFIPNSIFSMGSPGAFDSMLSGGWTPSFTGLDSTWFPGYTN